MYIVRHSDIESLHILPCQYMKWVEEALLHQYDCITPPKISVHLPNDGFFNTMPCYIPFSDVMGVKVVNRYLCNSPALDATLMLFEASTGKLKSIMDATLITSMRTGAVAATSIIKLKRKTQSNKLSILGLGATARSTLLCLLESLPQEFFDIKLLQYKDQAELFEQRFTGYSNVKFTIVNNNRDLIENADIVISCITSATEQIGENGWFKEGVLLVPVHTRGFQNCDLFFDKVFGDLTEQISQFKYFNQFKYFEEFARVVRNEVNGRDNINQRILVYNIGQALHDIFIAEKIFNLLSLNKINVCALKEDLSKFDI